MANQRKDAAGNPPDAKKRRILLNVNKASATLKAITIRNDQESPFLQFPKEVRDLVYKFALSDHIVHIDLEKATEPAQGVAKRRAPGLRHSICCSKTTQEQAYHGFVDATAESDALNVDHHADCANFAFHSNVDGYVDRLPMALLRTCRRIYFETSLLPYDNTFSFQEGHALDLFLSSIYPVQQRLIKSVRLEVRLGFNCTYNGASVITAKKLSYLNQLHVDIRMHNFSVPDLSLISQVPSHAFAGYQRMEYSHNLRRCPLLHVSVTITDQSHPLTHDPQWNLTFKQQAAQEFEALLMEPWNENKAKAIWAAEMLRDRERDLRWTRMILRVRKGEIKYQGIGVSEKSALKLEKDIPILEAKIAKYKSIVEVYEAKNGALPHDSEDLEG
ncbi:hypothetical protein EJ08DRAFT_683588 [Tothia fuscella]|uniref:DUF7730 domain-containing protein n=1 Tax=Tothia fuscella TaxID=1048955 RepID=A0A9P4NFI5_9PEZI|nr:hypothetical protein EJ08DRAFT_683588 [Tothia fuscella]